MTNKESVELFEALKLLEKENDNIRQMEPYL